MGCLTLIEGLLIAVAFLVGLRLALRPLICFWLGRKF